MLVGVEIKLSPRPTTNSAIPEESVLRDHFLGMSGGGGKFYHVLATCGFLLLAVGLVFGQTVHHDFSNLDDTAYVCLNRHVTDGLTAEAVKWAFTHQYAKAYTPVTWITHMLDCQFYHLNAGGHHLTNVLLHAATAVLLFLVLLNDWSSVAQCIRSGGFCSPSVAGRISGLGHRAKGCS